MATSKPAPSTTPASAGTRQCTGRTRTPHDLTVTIERLIEASPGYTLETLLRDTGVSDALLVPEPKPRLLSVDDACGYLGGISRMTLHRLIRNKQLQPVRIGSRVFFEAKDLDAFIRKAKRAGRTARQGGAL